MEVNPAAATNCDKRDYEDLADDEATVVPLMSTLNPFAAPSTTTTSFQGVTTTQLLSQQEEQRYHQDTNDDDTTSTDYYTSFQEEALLLHKNNTVSPQQDKQSSTLHRPSSSFSPSVGVDGATMSLLDQVSESFYSSPPDDDEDTHGPTSFAPARTPVDLLWLEMEDPTSPRSHKRQHHHHHQPQDVSPMMHHGFSSADHTTPASSSTTTTTPHTTNRCYHHEPIRTSSGLILTHRRAALSSSSTPMMEHVQPRRILHGDDYEDNDYGRDAAHRHDDDDDDEKKPSSFPAWFPTLTRRNHTRGSSSSGPMEVEYHHLDRYSSSSYSFATTITGVAADPYSSTSTTSTRKSRHYYGPPPNTALRQVQRLFRYVRVWMILSCLSLTIGTAILFRHVRQHELQSTSEQQQQQPFSPLTISSAYSSPIIMSKTKQLLQAETMDAPPAVQDLETAERVILLPLTNMSQLLAHRRQQHQQQEDVVVATTTTTTLDPPLRRLQQATQPQQPQLRRILRELRQDFEGWAEEHGKVYQTREEKEQRFRIWAKNHQRTVKKNERHGPCPLTNTPVFGSNLFKDLTPEEFKKQYLTGYHGPIPADEVQPQRSLREMKPLGSSSIHRRNIKVLRPDDPTMRRHPAIHQRLLEMGVPLPPLRSLTESTSSTSSSNFASETSTPSWSTAGCKWYDISCWLRWFYNTYGLGFAGTMEPKYDSDTYPTAMDWRDMGAVTSIHSQGNCGACWAITAVETIEAAHFIATGNLYELSESEIILCDNTCQMCNGGWPQNAYEYAMKHNGLPLEKTLPYNGDLLLTMTMVNSGMSDEMNTDTYQSYLQQACPSSSSNGGGGNNNNKDGKDSGRQGSYFNYFSNSYSQNKDSTRYGQIKGYGYATDRCICYSDGTGCNCDKQNEKMAVLNLASHGPATVCLEASLWQDYTGGIITSELGCSAKFLDMNHCVQAVGYAYMEEQQDGGGGGGGGGKDDKNNNNNNKGGNNNNNDNVKRDGYWIIRNQWSSGWGMNGYAYVAMGENTCGVLNDMTQAYY